MLLCWLNVSLVYRSTFYTYIGWRLRHIFINLWWICSLYIDISAFRLCIEWPPKFLPVDVLRNKYNAKSVQCLVAGFKAYFMFSTGPVLDIGLMFQFYFWLWVRSCLHIFILVNSDSKPKVKSSASVAEIYLVWLKSWCWENIKKDTQEIKHTHKHVQCTHIIREK